MTAVNLFTNKEKFGKIVIHFFTRRKTMEKLVNDMTVQRLLINLGITPKSNGYRYLTAAIMIKLSSRPGDIAMCKLYKRVSERFRVTTASVERCMRFAVTRTYNANQLIGINDLYDAVIISDTPTLSDFITYIVEYLYSFYQHDDLLIC